MIGALILLDIYSKDKATGLDIIHNQTSVFVAGAGGFGGPRTSNLAISPSTGMPTRSPDAIKEHKTDEDQVGSHSRSLTWVTSLIKFISRILPEIGSLNRMKICWPFFARILANLVNFDVKMFCPNDFDVKIARIWKFFARIFDTF